MTDTAKLRELLEKATPGPWTWVDETDDCLPKFVGTGSVNGVPVEVMNFGSDALYDQTAGDPPGESDRDLILAARNALPGLLRIVEAAQALCDSGYDGPFIGDAVAPLFEALALLGDKGTRE